MTTAAPVRTFSIDSLGHVVLRVRDVERSEAFYRDVLGMQVRKKVPGRAVFFTLGEQDHDLAVMAVGPDAPPTEETRVGLYHVAFRLRDIDQLRAAYRHLKASNANIVGINHHGVSKSIYLKDPDGIEIELYCDVPADPTGTEASVRAELEA
jgi:catechol-2,3-dioxygenase